MEKKEKKIIIGKDEAGKIKQLLEHEPRSEEECMGEDEAISHTADFGDGIQMDVKLCGVQYHEEESSNRPWTEAVLFDHGSEVACSDPEENYFGKWELEYGGVSYAAEVEEES